MTNKNLELSIEKNTYFNVVGPDGAGKDSALEVILPMLKNIVLFREPGGTPEAELIRETILTISEEKRKENFSLLKSEEKSKLLLEKTKKLLEKAELEYKKENIGLMEVYLYAASRSETNEKIVKTSLLEGKAVIGSRSVSCSMAYQGNARGIDTDFIWKTNMEAIDRLPDFEIFLDIPTEIAMERLAQRTGKQDRLDLESEEFHRKSREGYFKFYNQNKFPVFIVDATQTKEKVIYDILEIIKQTNNQKPNSKEHKNSFKF
jgi:dTMP kinase